MTAYKILNGPGKMDLMLGLFDSTGSKPRELRFTLRQDGYIHDEEVTVVLSRVEMEDGSGDNWNISGYIYTKDGPGSQKFTAFFSTDRRKGTMEIGYTTTTFGALKPGDKFMVKSLGPLVMMKLGHIVAAVRSADPQNHAGYRVGSQWNATEIQHGNLWTWEDKEPVLLLP